jgi:hypothetical protein
MTVNCPPGIISLRLRVTGEPPIDSMNREESPEARRVGRTHQRILTCRISGTEIPMPACTSNIAGQYCGRSPLIRVNRIGALMLNPRFVVAMRSTPAVNPPRITRSQSSWYPPTGVKYEITRGRHLPFGRVPLRTGRRIDPAEGLHTETAPSSVILVAPSPPEIPHELASSSTAG